MFHVIRINIKLCSPGRLAIAVLNLTKHFLKKDENDYRLVLHQLNAQDAQEANNMKRIKHV